MKTKIFNPFQIFLFLFFVPLISSQISASNLKNQKLYLLSFTQLLPSTYTSNQSFFSLQELTSKLMTNPQQIIAKSFIYLKVDAQNNLTGFSPTQIGSTQNFTTFMAQFQNQPLKILPEVLNSPSDSVLSLQKQPNAISLLSNNAIIKSTQFEGIGLFHEVPMNFEVNEIYRFAGKITDFSIFKNSIKNAPPGYNLINIVFQDITNNKTIKCYSNINQTTFAFEVPCKIDIIGKFYISIFAGIMGQSSSKPRNIVAPIILANSSLGDKPSKTQNVKFIVEDNDLYLLWNSSSAITVLTFSQNNLKISYTLSNFWSKFSIPYQDFYNFTAGPTNISIKHLTSKDGSYFARNTLQSDIFSSTFDSGQHKFSQINDPALNLQKQIPWQASENATIEVKGNFSIDIKKEGYLVDPKLSFSKFDIGLSNEFGTSQLPLSYIAPNTTTRFSLNFRQPGTYLITVYATSGLALINRPIYIGKIIPLLPDFMDMKLNTVSSLSYSQKLRFHLQKTLSPNIPLQPSSDSPMPIKQAFLLSLLNALRTKFSKGPLYLSPLLSSVAQQHANDMEKQNYFGHSDLKGNGVGQRVIERASIQKSEQGKGSFGENLAKSTSLTEAHLSLERSAAHLENSLEGMWTRVGIGLKQDKSGIWIIVLVFGSRDLKMQPLSSLEIGNLKNMIIGLAIERSPHLTQNTTLSQTIQKYLTSQSSSNQTLPAYLFNNKFTSTLSWTSFKVTYQSNWLSMLKNNANFLKIENRYKQVGVGVSIGEDWSIDGTVVFI